MRRFLRQFARGVVILIAILLAVFGLLVATAETAWGKNQIRALIVREANQYLTARLDIGRLGGSLVRGLELGDIRLTRDGQTIVAVDAVAVSFSLRELLQNGTVIRRIQLTHPQVVAARQSDGRWNLAALVKRDARDHQRSGPGRPIEIQSIEVVDGLVSLKDPLTFGAAHVPGRFEHLNLTLAFGYQPVSWRLAITRASWLGGPSDLAVDHLSGTIASGHDGWALTDLILHTAQSALAINGRVMRGSGPTSLDLHAAAERFVFQEWAGVLPALAKMPIDSRFDTQLTGPLTALRTTIDLQSNGGAARGTVVLDTTVPGWHGVGALDVARLDLAPWFNDPTRASNISGLADFDVQLQLGRGVPRGVYKFDGSHAAYAGYEGDNVHVRGDITADDWRMSAATAVAYGSKVRIGSGRIALASPHAFHFQGAASGVDLRALPATIPVPHVESVLSFGYDVNGQFSVPFIAGQARFDDSTFLGARVAGGTVGSIDTSAVPIVYSGEGDLSEVVLHRFGADLDLAWLQDPRYAGILAGHFRVEGAGADSETMSLHGSGRLARATLFEGVLSDADVDVQIDGGSLTGSYDGAFATVNPAVAFVDERLAASLTGRGRMHVVARGLLVASPALSDYDIDGAVTLADSKVADFQLDSGALTASLSESRLSIAALHAAGPRFDVQGSGSIGLAEDAESSFDYDVARGDLSLVQGVGDVSGTIASAGHLSGPWRALHLTGGATINHLAAAGVTALVTSGDYDVTVPWDTPADATGRVTGRSSFIEALGETIQDVSGTASYAANRLTADLTLAREDGLNGALAGTIVLHPGERAIDLDSARGSLGGIAWQMVSSVPPPVLSWDDDGVSVTPLSIVDTVNGDQRIDLAGSWRPAGGGSMHVAATHVFLDTLAAFPAAPADAARGPAIYGGLVDLDATVSGTTAAPIVTGRISVTDGRVRQLTYEKLAGRVDYADGMLDVDLRLDQSPGIWLTAVGTAPPTLFDATQPERPVNIALTSSDVNVALLEGLTSAVTNVTGRLRTDLRVTGTTRALNIAGPVEMAGIGFQLASTGSRYKNGNATLQFSTDRIDVSAFHLEDRNGRPLEVRGSLGTHELRVGDLEIDIRARDFEVVNNATGDVQVDANLKIRGQFEAPRLFGDVSIAGGQLRVDELLSRVLFQPYSTQAAAPVDTDVISALNPWNRLSLDINVHSQSALRMTGDNVLVTEDAPLGLGSFNLRASGDLFVYKEPGQEVSITGSLDSISGSYSFQGRRFDLYPSSAIDFRGDLDPGIFISVYRIISGIETRVTISGTLHEPELQLSSTPPLDPSDILALVVFNTSTSELSASQQQELAVRAGALAAGFLTSSLTTALGRSLGLDILEIEPPVGASGGTKITVGGEIAPRIVARFTRQFGVEQYDEGSIDYQISRMLRLRATFSDAGVLSSPFRRVEPYGIDLLLFFSF